MAYSYLMLIWSECCSFDKLFVYLSVNYLSSNSVARNGRLEILNSVSCLSFVVCLKTVKLFSSLAIHLAETDVDPSITKKTNSWIYDKCTFPNELITQLTLI